MNKTIGIILLIVSSVVLCGCKKWLEETQITICSAIINGIKYEYQESYKPLLGPTQIDSFEFSNKCELGRKKVYLNGGVVICFVIKCTQKDFKVSKRFTIKPPMLDNKVISNPYEELWSLSVVKYIPVDCDGIAFIYNWQEYSKDKPIGLHGYLEVKDLVNGYYRNEFELMSDSLPPLQIMDGYFLTEHLQ